MSAPVTQEYEELVLEFSSDQGVTWARNCVIQGVTVSRTANIDEVETPADCDDESLPHDLRRRVRSKTISVSGTGQWTQGGYNSLLTKWHAGELVSARIGNLGAASGEIEYEQCLMVIPSLGESRTKGQVVSAEVTLDSAGPITVSLKA